MAAVHTKEFRYKGPWLEEKKEEKEFDLEKIVADLLLERKEWEEYKILRLISVIGLVISTFLVTVEYINA